MVRERGGGSGRGGTGGTGGTQGDDIGKRKRSDVVFSGRFSNGLAKCH